MPDSFGPSDFFEGVIRALGLEIPAATNVLAPAKENEIVWTRQSDGGLVATIFASDTIGGGNEDTQLRITANNAHGNDSNAEVEVNASLQDRAILTQLLLATALSGAGVQTGSLTAQAASGRDSKLVLDEQGRSDFVTSRKNVVVTGLVGELGLRMIRGAVSTVGPNGSIVRGGGFGLGARPGVGQLNITFTAPFASAPSVVATAEADGITGGARNITQNGCLLTSAQPGVYSDQTINFLAIGPT